jgi:predicted DNA-binding transcriptional regulator
MKMNELNLTELESKTLTAFIGGLYAEPGFSDVDVNDLSKELEISTKVLRGVLGSLVKKGIVFIDAAQWVGGYDIIYLCERYWYLVNEEWASEARVNC